MMFGPLVARTFVAMRLLGLLVVAVRGNAVWLDNALRCY